MRIVRVPLEKRSYPIFIGDDVLTKLGKVCRRQKLGALCAVISDSTVAPLYGEAACAALRSAGFKPALLVVPAGETAKDLKQVRACYDQLAHLRLERSSFIVALGGGVVGDLAGFVAATYLRGLAFIQIPTTLLAQVDSSVGGKVGVNLRAGKNLVGAFYQPRFVLCDLGTLDTLPPREFRAGLAEVIKYGIICDAPLFRRLERELPKILRRDRGSLAPIIARCCAIKAQVVGQDETEGGLRAILNYGHTIGHALEAVFGYGRFLHGEAISIGQIAAAKLSAKLLGLPGDAVKRITDLFDRAGLPTGIRLSPRQRAQLFDAMKLDKKTSGGEIKFVLARQIGVVEFGHRVPVSLIEDALAT